MRMSTHQKVAFLLGWAVCIPQVRAAATVVPVAGQAELGGIEVHGVAAGEFASGLWEAGTLHWLPDQRTPLIAPRWSGLYRNIYAPSAVEVPGGWRLFYGAWDGVATGNDRIYSVRTPDFLDFGDRRTVIEHGSFIHVCNVTAVRLRNGAFHLICTAYPDARDRNKPAAFHSPDGQTWNGAAAPYRAGMSDIVSIEGYAPYADADINGVNVVLHEADTYRLYFNDYRNWGRVWRASAADGKRFRLEAECLKTDHAVNDVKKIVQESKPTYLMGLHRNGDRLWYSLSADGMTFGPEHELVKNLDDRDKYIVAVGWVTRGSRVLGLLYGAGAVPELNRNRLFARWLQKKVVFVANDGRRFEPTASLGPDRQMIPLGDLKKAQGHFEVLSEDGRTPLVSKLPAEAVSGGVYRLVLP